MTAEELSALIKDEIGEDARLHTILDRIRDGKANLTDSELYAAITARITAQQMRRNVLSLDKREAAFVDITRERYTDTFTVFSAVQRILDAENGIHIKPQKPPFEDGRAHKIGHSLEDRTVPDSTIERRARSATENFCMSHHDDCMRVNAEFRARAGLQSYAIREGGAKCCDWCADVSGKYPANETPAGFWGRHDNCKCSILYETKKGVKQFLQGRAENTRGWEVVAEGAGAEQLVRLTHEQAAAIQERNRLTVLTHEQALALQAVHGLTILPRNGTIELEMYHAGLSGSILKSVQRILTGEPSAVSDEYIKSLPKLSKPDSIMRALRMANPSKDGDNCARCVPAYEMRRRGFDVFATKAPKNWKEDEIGIYGFRKVFIGMEWKKCADDGKNEIERFLIDSGNGARVEISLKTTVGSHLFIAENENGVIRFLDPQKALGNVERYFKYARTGPTEYARIDNLALSDLIKECLEVAK